MKILYFAACAAILVLIHLVGGCADDGHNEPTNPDPIPYWISQPRTHLNP